MHLKRLTGLALVLASTFTTITAQDARASLVDPPDRHDLSAIVTQAAHRTTALVTPDTLSPLNAAALVPPAVGATGMASANWREAALSADVPRVTLRPDHDVSLAIWHCIRAIRAQRDNRPLQLIESRLQLVTTLNPPTSVVPLPGAAWLLLMGLLGFAGARLHRRGDQPQEPAKPWRAAAPLPV